MRRPNRDERQARRAARKAERQATAAPAPAYTPSTDIAPDDPILAYFQSSPEPVDVDQLKLESPGVRALRTSGVKLVVSLVAQGEIIGSLKLGERLSEQGYSADDRKLLEHLAGQAAPALRVAQLVREQQAEARRRERYEQEMRVAQLIQQHLLPKELPAKAGWDVNVFYRSAREVGGDLYDVIDLSDGRLAILVADVTHKGVPAALVMASTRSVLRSSAQRLVEPGAVLERVNDIVAQDMHRTCSSPACTGPGASHRHVPVRQRRSQPAASTLAVTAAFRPVRTRTMRFMDRRFNRASYLAEQVTADFAKQVRESVDQDTIGGALLELARTPLQPATAGLCPVGSAEPNTGYEP